MIPAARIPEEPTEKPFSSPRVRPYSIIAMDNIQQESVFT